MKLANRRHKELPQFFGQAGDVVEYLKLVAEDVAHKTVGLGVQADIDLAVKRYKLIGN